MSTTSGYHPDTVTLSMPNIVVGIDTVAPRALSALADEVALPLPPGLATGFDLEFEALLLELLTVVPLVVEVDLLTVVPLVTEVELHAEKVSAPTTNIPTNTFLLMFSFP